MKKLIFLTLLFYSILSNAQVTFEKKFNLSKIDVGKAAQQTTDNGYIIVGHTAKTGSLGDKDVLLIKTDFLGDTLWTKTFGGDNYETGKNVRQTNDNGYIITGHTNSFGSGEADIYLIKTDSLGNEIWSNTIGGTGIDWGLSIRQTNDNGYIITGSTSSYNLGNPNLFIVKTNDVGAVAWTKNYGGSGTERGNSIIITSDGGYVICGYTTSFGFGNYDLYLVKINDVGDTLWTRTYGGVNKDCGMSVQQTSDNGFIITGYTESFGAGDMDVYLIKTNEIGDTLWTKTFGGALYDIGCSVSITSDNGYIIVGYAESFGNGTIDIYLLKTNQYGDTIWTQLFEGKNTDYGNSVHQTIDGGFIIGGTTFNEDSLGLSNSDVYLIKTDNNGMIVNLFEPFISQNNFKLYPNPNNGRFIIETKNNVNSIEIYNISGQLVFIKESASHTHNHKADIELHNFEKGLYFIIIHTETQTTVKKLIIN